MILIIVVNVVQNAYASRKKVRIDVDMEIPEGGVNA